MITIPIWLFVVLVVLSAVSLLIFIIEIIAYCSTLKMEKDYHNRKNNE